MQDKGVAPSFGADISSGTMSAIDLYRIAQGQYFFRNGIHQDRVRAPWQIRAADATLKQDIARK